jgi:hypothetical protein
MTQGIERTLNLPPLEEALKEHGLIPETPIEENNGESAETNEIDFDSGLAKTLELAQQAQDRLDMVEGKDHSEAMDKVFNETLKHAQDLMDLGFNIDTRSMRGIFEVATNMYNTAISAKNSKRDAQLKAMKLALDQRKLDLDEKRIKSQLNEPEQPVLENGSGTVIVEDRNALIKRIRENAKK